MNEREIHGSARPSQAHIKAHSQAYSQNNTAKHTAKHTVKLRSNQNPHSQLAENEAGQGFSRYKQRTKKNLFAVMRWEVVSTGKNYR